MTPRILIVIAAPDWACAEPALQEAHRLASDAQRLSCGLCLGEEPGRRQQRAMNGYPALRWVSGMEDAWQAMPGLWRGEDRVLIAPADARFTPRWDLRLNQELEACGAGDCALTGFLPAATDAVDAVCPVAAAGFDEQGRLLLGRGTPLRYAKRSERSAFLHPEFCFAPAAFFRAAAEAGPPYFLAAFRRRWRLYTLREPILRRVEDRPLPPCDPPPEGPALGRFERFFGLSFAERTLSDRAMVGLWTADLTARTSVPLRVRLRERLRTLDNAVSRLDPLCVTACYAAPEAGDAALARFRYLSGIRQLQLLCYADRQAALRLKPVHPYIAELRAGVGLPSPVPVSRQNAGRWARLSKAFLLQHARSKDMSRTHYVWIDYDYLGYPVYRNAALDWETVCCERVTLALVDGVPDLSMFTVPQELLPLLTREISGRCEEAAAQGLGLPGERALWQGLMAEYPEWFNLIPLPTPKELLSLTLGK
ncbi:MAG: hypothetical protein IKP40_00405 [Clostridia bacterium]|nr:hypothetical protein [Clostridia bacterium]